MTGQPEPSPLVGAAVATNAHWCAAMCRAHGLTGRATDRVWSSAARAPLFYPDAITLQPGCSAEQVLSGVGRDEPGASVKDSYADLDLSGHGFDLLFDAQWVTVDRTDGSGPASDSWRTVDGAAGLRRWADAWDVEHADLFVPTLLDDTSTTVIARPGADDAIVAGAVLTSAAGVVGVSNVFGPDEAAWPGVLATAARLFPGVPVVGYESGANLATAIGHGARPIGPLRVWLAA